MLFKLNMDILHPANRSSDSLTTCRSVQRSTGNDRGHYDINCENFSETTLNKNLLINYGSFALTMEEQRKLGLLDSGQQRNSGSCRCNRDASSSCRSREASPRPTPSPLPSPHQHCNNGCDHHQFVSAKAKNGPGKSNCGHECDHTEDPSSVMTSQLSPCQLQQAASSFCRSHQSSMPRRSSTTADLSKSTTAADKTGANYSHTNQAFNSSTRRSERSSRSLVETIFSQSGLFLLSFYLLVIFLSPADACSSRSTPKPRPPSPTMRPNITFQTYACPPAYAAWYCLNGATCFTVKIGISILYNCECADGFMGQRCEFKDLDGTYLPTREKLKMALGQVRDAASSLPVGLLVIVILVALAAFAFTKRRTTAKLRRIEAERSEEEDEPSYETADTSFSEASTQSPDDFWRETESCSPGKSSAMTQTTDGSILSPPQTPALTTSRSSVDQLYASSSIVMPNNYLPSAVSSPGGLEQMFSLETELSKLSSKSRNNSNDEISTRSPKRGIVTSSSPRVHQLTVQPLVVKPVAAAEQSSQQDVDPESPVQGCDDTPVTFYLPSATSNPASSLSSSPSILATAPSYSSPTPSSTKSWKSRRSPGGSSRSRSARSAWMEDNEMSVMASTLSFKLDSSI